VASPPTADLAAPVRRISPAAGHHFHGYYDIQPWDSTGRCFLCLEVGFMDRPPTAGDVARLGLINLSSGRFEPLAETFAWNFQQGCMAHWLGSAPDREIIFNAREGDRFVAVVLDVHSGKRRVLAAPVAAVSDDGRWGLGLNFARLAVMRPGYGYAGVADPFAEEFCPEADGVTLLDIATGQARLVVPMAELAGELPAELRGLKLYVNHALFSDDGSRFAFLPRFTLPGGKLLTAMYTADRDGGRRCRLLDYGLVSHFDWLGSTHVLVWAGLPNPEHQPWPARRRYFLIRDRAPEDCRVVGPDGDVVDGHCSYSPDRKWILTDTYPDQDDLRTMYLLDPADGRRTVLGRFLAPRSIGGEIRCDLHPCWSRDGRQISFDSSHEGRRAVYVMDAAGEKGARNLLCRAPEGPSRQKVPDPVFSGAGQSSF